MSIRLVLDFGYQVRSVLSNKNYRLENRTGRVRNFQTQNQTEGMVEPNQLDSMRSVQFDSRVRQVFCAPLVINVMSRDRDGN